MSGMASNAAWFQQALGFSAYCCVFSVWLHSRCLLWPPSGSAQVNPSTRCWEKRTNWSGECVLTSWFCIEASRHTTRLWSSVSLAPRDDLGFRLISEQVSHHPPVSAFHAEGLKQDFVFHGSIYPKLKFWGKSVEAEPKGIITLELPKYELLVD